MAHVIHFSVNGTDALAPRSFEARLLAEF